jgi:predicted amidohydrolase
LICFDLNISSTLARIAMDNGCEILFSPTLIRDTGLENWKVYLQARALEMRAPIVSCNSIFDYKDRKFLGQSKIIQFQRGAASPVKIILDEASQTPCILTREVDLDFPNNIRRDRLDEVIDKKDISVNKISK